MARRRKTQSHKLERVVQESRFDGYQVEGSNVNQLFSYAVYLCGDLGLNPSLVENGLTYEALQIDENGYKTRYRNRHRSDVSSLVSDCYSMIKARDSGGPRDPGNLANLRITKTARKILEASYGKKWKEAVSLTISEAYEQNGKPHKNYTPLNDDVSFKLSKGKILVQASLGEARYKNGHIVLPGKVVPDAMKISLIGKPVKEIIEGAVYDDAINECIIINCECPDKTTVISLEEDEERIDH